MDDRDDALLVCGKVNLGAHIRANVADVLDRDLRLDGERILIGHDIKYLLAALNDAADRKHAERHDLAGIGPHLGLAADDLRTELVDLLPDHAALTLDCRTPAFELAELAIPNCFEVAIFRPGLEVLRQHHLGAAIEFGQKTYFGGPK